MTSGRVESVRFPYVPVTISLRGQRDEVEALLDTGFDGGIVIPEGFIAGARPPDGYVTWRLADGSEVLAPVHLGEATVAGVILSPVVVTVLGHEPIVGREVSDRFMIVLDRGQRVIVEP